MNDDAPEPQRVRAARFVTAMSLVSYPCYPDPSTDSGWADVPAVLLLVDLTGREDIVYAAMIQGAALIADDLELRISAPDDIGTCVYLLIIDLDVETPLEIAGVADQEAIRMFAEADNVSRSTRPRENDTSQRFTSASRRTSCVRADDVAAGTRWSISV